MYCITCFSAKTESQITVEIIQLEIILGTEIIVICNINTGTTLLLKTIIN